MKKIELELDLDLFIDSIINAIEGYSYYWVVPISTNNLLKRLENGEEIEIYDSEDDKTQQGVLSMKTITKGIQKLIVEYPKQFQHIMTEQNDSIDDDILLQLCVIGEVIYANHSSVKTF